MIKVNLLRPEKKDVSATGEAVSYIEEEKEKKLSLSAIVTALGLAVVVIGALYYFQANTLSDKENELKARKARKAELEEALKEIEQLKKTRDMLTRKVKVIENLKSKQQHTVKMMDQLSKALPDWVWLTSLRFTGNSLRLTGKALSNNLIADFINNLKGTNHFYNVQFNFSTRRQEGGQDVFSFSISCRYLDKLVTKKVV